jgi:hypothetical protein
MVISDRVILRQAAFQPYSEPERNLRRRDYPQ